MHCIDIIHVFLYCTSHFYFLFFILQSLGNHEFDDGPSGLAPYLRNVSVPVLGCNLGLAGEPSMANTTVTPSIVIERGGLRIGIIGYLTPETMVGNLPFEEDFNLLYNFNFSKYGRIPVELR